MSGFSSRRRSHWRAVHRKVPGDATLVLGYFDRGNLGDDRMIEALREYRDEGHDFVSLPLGPPTYRNLFSLVSALFRADRSVLLGGTHFDTADGERKMLVLMLKHLALSLLAKVCRSRYEMLGIGLTEPNGMLLKLVLRLNLSFASVVCVRDAASAAVFHRLTGRTCPLLCDPAYLAEPHLSYSPASRTLLVAPARRGQASSISASDVAAAAARAGMTRVRMLAAYSPPDRLGDRECVSEIMDQLLSEQESGLQLSYVTYSGAPCAPEIWDDVGYVFSERYHVSLLAAQAGIPVNIVANTTKQQALAQAYRASEVPSQCRSRAQWCRYIGAPPDSGS